MGRRGKRVGQLAFRRWTLCRCSGVAWDGRDGKVGLGSGPSQLTLPCAWSSSPCGMVGWIPLQDLLGRGGHLLCSFHGSFVSLALFRQVLFTSSSVLKELLCSRRDRTHRPVWEGHPPHCFLADLSVGLNGLSVQKCWGEWNSALKHKVEFFF